MALGIGTRVSYWPLAASFVVVVVRARPPAGSARRARRRVAATLAWLVPFVAVVGPRALWYARPRPDGRPLRRLGRLDRDAPPSRRARLRLLRDLRTTASGPAARARRRARHRRRRRPTLARAVAAHARARGHRGGALCAVGAPGAERARAAAAPVAARGRARGRVGRATRRRPSPASPSPAGVRRFRAADRPPRARPPPSSWPGGSPDAGPGRTRRSCSRVARAAHRAAAFRRCRRTRPTPSRHPRHARAALRLPPRVFTSPKSWPTTSRRRPQAPTRACTSAVMRASIASRLV